MADDLRQTDVGFKGGPVLAVRATEQSYSELVKSLEQRAEGWQTLETEESEILIDLTQVVYIRRERGDQKVGF
jgi:Holliday junction resolvase